MVPFRALVQRGEREREKDGRMREGERRGGGRQREIQLNERGGEEIERKRS